MTDVATAVEIVAFSVVKSGSADSEWEDGAGYDPGDPRSGRPARLVVVDGATEAYDAIRWVALLVNSFLAPDGRAPTLDPTGLDAWFGMVQQRWADSPREFASVFEEHKFHESGSFATFLGCEVRGLGGPTPRWAAAAIGDTVLFQVRDGRVVARFPDLAAEDFGVTPPGISTQPTQRPRMRAALGTRDGTLQVGTSCCWRRMSWPSGWCGPPGARTRSGGSSPRSSTRRSSGTGWTACGRPAR